jgi:hypothetical protein
MKKDIRDYSPSWVTIAFIFLAALLMHGINRRLTATDQAILDLQAKQNKTVELQATSEALQSSASGLPHSSSKGDSQP